MIKGNFNKIEVLLIDVDGTYRQALHTMLRAIGFRNIHQGNTMQDIKRNFLVNEPDLVISDTKLPDGDLCNFIYGLRHHSVGGNPFIPVLALTADPTAELVRKVVNSGADDLLTKPLSANQLMERIDTLIEARKPFVVTSDYIGPTRRKPSNRESNVPLLEVPNTLRDKAKGLKADKGLQQAIDAAVAEINLQKLERYGVQIVYLADHIVPALLDGIFNEDVRRNIARLNYVAEDTSRRMKGTKYEHVSELCQTMIKVAKDIHAAGNKPSPRDIKLLKPLAFAIQAGFETGSVTAAREIVASLSVGDESS